MISVRQDIVIATNAAFDTAARWTDGVGTPYELSDALLQVRRPSGGTVVLEASKDNGLITLEDPDWWAAVLVDEDTTKAITTFGVFVYDLVVARALDGRVEQLLRGMALIREGVTQYPPAP